MAKVVLTVEQTRRNAFWCPSTFAFARWNMLLVSREQRHYLLADGFQLLEIDHSAMGSL